MYDSTANLFVGYGESDSFKVLVFGRSILENMSLQNLVRIQVQLTLEQLKGQESSLKLRDNSLQHTFTPLIYGSLLYCSA